MNGRSEKPAFEPRELTLRDGRVVLLRAAEPDDAPAILAYLRLRTPEFTEYILSLPEEMDFTEEQERGIIADVVASPGSLMMVVLAGDEVVAMLSCRSNDRRRRIAHVAGVGMSSAKAYWGSGLGTHMMSALIVWAEANPVLGMLELSVYACNERALRLYRQSGFIEIGTVPGRTRFNDGTTRDDIRMYRPVERGNNG